MRIVCLLVLLVLIKTAFAQPRDTINIYFELGSPALTAQAKHKLDSLLYNNVIAPRRKVGIIGYADIIGGGETNKVLSTERAVAVKHYLLKMNVDSNDIEWVTGKGEITRPEKENGYPRDRKVAIIPGGFTSKKPLPAKSKGQKKLGDIISYNGDTPVIDVEQIDVNSLFKLDKVYFNLGKSNLLPQSYPMLNALYNLMKDNPSVKIQIEGHVCCSPPYTIVNNIRVPIPAGVIDTAAFTTVNDLSVYRSYEVFAYLVRRGIQKSRINYIGYGTKRMLVKPEVTEEDKAANRRVEVRIVAK